MLRILALVVVFVVLAGASASEPKLFGQQQITIEQWQTLRTEVKTGPGARDASRPEQPDIETIVVPEKHSIYYFTTGGPAHPAVITFRPVQQNGTFTAMHIESYFAGSKEAFQNWFTSFLVSQFPPQLPHKAP